MSDFAHIPVLLDECVNALNVKAGGVYIDCTVGGGGHSFEIARRLDFSTAAAESVESAENATLICFDKDKAALQAATEKLSGFPVVFINDDFSNIKKHAQNYAIGADGILMDLGVSSHQLDSAERGFSFHDDAPLDMRMGGEGLSAYDVVNAYSFEDLTRILFDYGEEKFAKGIVNGIIKSREEKPIATTGELAEIIRNNVPLKIRREKNPCRKTFQAIRIEVNRELESLKAALPDAFELLNKGGRLAIITFHSLEDRIVKNAFKEFAQGCICPPEFPVCVCGKKPKARLVTRKPITASAKELSQNTRSRSAKLRIIEKL